MKEKIYLIPGLMCDKRLWNNITPILSELYELVHIEIPLSSNFDEIVAILHDKIKDEKINLFGFSFGAYIASYFTVKYPHHVNKLFLNAGTPSKMTQEEILKRNKMIEMMNDFGFRGISYKKVASLLEEPNQEDEKLITLIKEMYSDLGEEVYMAQMKTINNRIPLENDLKNLTIPIKMFYSTNDRLLNYDSLDVFTQDNTHITKISRIGTSHMIPLEVPKLLSQEIIDWMQQ